MFSGTTRGLHTQKGVSPCLTQYRDVEDGAIFPVGLRSAISSGTRSSIVINTIDGSVDAVDTESGDAVIGLNADAIDDAANAESNNNSPGANTSDFQSTAPLNPYPDRFENGVPVSCSISGSVTGELGKCVGVTQVIKSSGVRVAIGALAWLHMWSDEAVGYTHSSYLQVSALSDLDPSRSKDEGLSESSIIGREDTDMVFPLFRRIYTAFPSRECSNPSQMGIHLCRVLGFIGVGGPAQENGGVVPVLWDPFLVKSVLVGSVHFAKSV